MSPLRQQWLQTSALKKSEVDLSPWCSLAKNIISMTMAILFYHSVQRSSIIVWYHESAICQNILPSGVEYLTMATAPFSWWYHVPTEKGWCVTMDLQYYHCRRPPFFVDDINKGLRRLAALSSPPHVPQPHIKNTLSINWKNSIHQTRLQCVVWGSLISPNRQIPLQLSYTIMLRCWNPTKISLNMNK